MLKKLSAIKLDQLHSEQISVFLAVIIIAVIGTYLIIGSHAANPYASITAHQGTLVNGAIKQSCSGASDGNCVVFGGTVVVPNHIETWGYDDGCNGGIGASATLVRQWLTYAEANCGPDGDTKNLADCVSGTTTYCKVVQYLDTNIIYYSASGASPQWPQYNSASASATDDSWFLHPPTSSPSSSTLDAATRLSITAYGGGYFDNVASPAVQSFYQNYARTNFPNTWGLMMDDTGSSTSDLLYQASGPVTSSDEIPTDSALVSAHKAMAAMMTHSDGTPYIQINNGDGPNPYEPSSLPLLNNPSSVVGMIAEGDPWSSGTIIPNWEYQDLLDEMGYMDHTVNDFQILLSYDSSGSATQTQGRRVQAATILLGYSSAHTVSWSDLEQGSGNLAVWPEEGIYPTHPIQSMGEPSGTGCFAGNGVECPTGGHNDIQVATGVYRREFQECYKQGVAFGPCAAIVNDSSSPITIASSWLTQTYTHQITMVGGDVQSGGSVDVTGASFTPGTTTIATGDAVLLAQ
jgi:hypothetical protein